MAKRRRKSTRRVSNAGRRRAAPRKAMRRHTRRRNPAGLGRPADWITGGAGVIAGGVLSRAIPQMLLGSGNTGAMGYAANAVASLGLGWVAHMMFPSKPLLVTTVIAGGFGSLIQRVISDRTPYGSVLSGSGLGDYGLGLYQKSNFNMPQRIQNGRIPSAGSSMFTWGDGSQGRVSSIANAGSDTTMGAC